VPTRPETGYGYIEIDPASELETGAHASAGFREKPDAETAQFFFESGRFRWNSGMFFFTLNAFLRELGSAQPDALAVVRRIALALSSNSESDAESAYAELPNLSIDYAVAEKCTQMYVVEAEFGWDDVGAWDALARTFDERDAHGNVVFGSATLSDVHNSIIYNASSGQTIAAVGLREMVVATTDDAVMVCAKSDSQRVKEIVDRLKAESSPLL
jgi:mannose-1-phosphate guanylyltransferase